MEEKGQVVLQDAKNFFLTKLLDGFKGGLKTTEHYLVKKGKDKKSYRLIFKKDSSKRFGVKEVRLLFGKGKTKKIQMVDLDELRILHLDKKWVTMKFRNFKAVKPLKKEHFHFKVTDKMEVISR